MQISSLLKASFVAAAVIASASALTVRAQGIPGSLLVSPINVVSLTSFEPNAQFLNPTFPISLALRHTATGNPAHYRFSRFADFRDATWLPYAPLPQAQIPASWFETFTPAQGVFNRRVVLYFQVRATNPNAARPISVTTNPFTRVREVATEPQFVNSSIRNKVILAGFSS